MESSIEEQRGRPRIEGGLQRRRNITLSDELAELAKTIGSGNISEGIRIALNDRGKCVHKEDLYNWVMSYRNGVNSYDITAEEHEAITGIMEDFETQFIFGL